MPIADPKQTLYLVDISSFIFRAFFAVRHLSTRAGVPTNAVYGVATMLARLAEEAKPEYLAVVYDSKEPSFRKEIYPEYKANRSETPDDLIPQFDLIEQLVSAFEIHSYRQSGIEADDLIATLTRRWLAESREHSVVIVTGDKDLMQLVGDRVRVWDTMKNIMFSSPEVKEKFGVLPEQVRDYLALVGDSSDNIPGVPSIGPKSASDLLNQFGTLDKVLAAAEAGKISGKKGEVLKTHVEDARLSARLATVREDLEVKISFDELKYHFHVNQKCADLLTSLDFHTLVKRWTIAEGAAPGAAPSTPVGVSGTSSSPASTPAAQSLDSEKFRTANTEAVFAEVIKGIERRKEFGFDLETTSLNPREAELVGIAICFDLDYGYYIPVGHRGTPLQPEVKQLPLQWVLDRLRPYLENPKYKKIGQNLKYDFSVLLNMGINMDGIGADTMVADYVLHPEGRHNLETLAANYFNYDVKTFEMVCGKGKDQLGFDQIAIDVATRYSAEDAWMAYKLWDEQKRRLESEKLMEIFYRVDLPLVQVLGRMECNGVCIDDKWLAKLSKEFSLDLRRIEERVATFTNGPINLNSPKQLAHLLFDQLKLPTQSKTKTGFSTDASVLEALAPMHEVPALLLEYREISKLKGTYVDPLPLLRDKKTGKIHAGFHQAVAATGRLSSADPNLQNIPIRSERGKMIRRAFIPSPGNILVAADYSQIELRILAHMSGDKELVDAFRKDQDVHRRTAADIFGVSQDAVDDRQRGIAKAINFGLMYGKTAFGLSQELKIPRREAQETIDRYFERYSGVKKFLDNQVAEAKERGYVQTVLGRKRALPDINAKNAAVRTNAERMAMNSPIQGTAADLIKLAMTELDAELISGGYHSKLIIQVHDEMVLDCPRDESDKVSKLLVRVMEGAMKMDVPLRVNVASGENWMEL